MSESNKRMKAADDKTAAGQDKARPVEVVSLDMGPEGEETVDLDPETTRELLRQAQKEEYAKEVAEYTDDEAVQEALEERQALDSGEQELADRLREHHASSPALAAGDLDAAWDQADVGDETAGGTAVTPDQDRVDEFGQAYGIDYEDDEPLHTEEKLAERDRQRWELDPRSTEEEAPE
ncbi:MAG: DUF6335 family protein [Candidatus Promineifilaceae bacterium]